MALRQGRQIVGDGEDAPGHQCEEQRHRKVDGDGRHHPGELGQRRVHELAEVVVVQVAAGEPGVVGRHGRRSDDGIEVGEVHRLLAATKRVPQVRVPHPDAVEAEEGHEEQQLADEDQTRVAPEEVQHLSPLESEDHGRDRRDEEQAHADGEAREVQPVQAGEEPGDVGDQQNAEHLAQQVAAVGQPAEDRQGYGQRQQER